MKAKRLLPLLGLALLAGGCAREEAEKPPVDPLVTAQEVTDAATAQQLQLSGQVQSRRQAPLSFRVSGKIAERTVSAGDKVAPGQVLLQMDPTDFTLQASARAAQADAAKAQFENATEELARHKRMLEKNLIGAAEMDRMESQWRQAKAAYEAAAAQAQNAENELAYTQLTADAPALITDVLAEEGQVVQAGQPVLRMARLNQLEVEVSIPEDYVRRINTGDAVSVSIPALGGFSIDGQIREIAGMADPRTRTYAARVALPETDEDVKLGMTANVTVRAPFAEGGVVVPARSVVAGKEKEPVVWLIGTDNRVVAHTVKVIGISGDSLIVSGLDKGSRIVVQGARLLDHGGKVRILEQPSGAPGQQAQQKDQTVAPRPLAVE